MKIAVKQLTKSDLSFFAVHVRESKQKAINLNSDVFIAKFFPGLSGAHKPIHLPVRIIGPGGGTTQTLSRKIIKSPRSKNWRLNGEVVYAPQTESELYDRLSPGDFAILGFDGQPEPTSATLILISKADDSQLHQLFEAQWSLQIPETMMVLEDLDLESILLGSDRFYDGNNPLQLLSQPDTVEDVLFGEIERVSSRGLSSPISQEQLENQLQNAQKTGALGEELFQQWLFQLRYSEDDFIWISQTHARSAYDYELHSVKWLSEHSSLFVDVKTTSSSYETNIHMSTAELRWASNNQNYRIARVSQISEISATIDILKNVSPLASQILKGLDRLPSGVKVDSVNFSPDMLQKEHSGSVSIDVSD